MKKRVIRRYTDVNGKPRKLIMVEQLSYFVPWRKNTPSSPATRWECEDGYIIQVPDNAWNHLNISYEDEVIEVV